MSGGQVYAPDFLRSIKGDETTEMLHEIADMIENQVDKIHKFYKFETDTMELLECIVNLDHYSAEGAITAFCEAINNFREKYIEKYHAHMKSKYNIETIVIDATPKDE